MVTMRIAVSGASGLIGSALTASLAADGHEVVHLVRREPRTPAEVRWDPMAGTVDTTGLAGCEAVVHLAGAGVGQRRWTEARKKVLRDSRVLGTAAIARAAAALDPRPRVLVCGSAIGYYGDTGDAWVDEDSPKGTGFLADLVRDWEAAADPARAAGIRTVHTRTGLVVARSGGAWAPLFPIFRAGLGGRLGSGRQFWSFIALRDEIAAIRHAITTESLSGPVNLTAPEPLTNREITAAMGRALHRPTLAAVPAPVLRLALGEFAGDVLSSQRVRPRRLLDSGFAFSFPHIDEAISAALDPALPGPGGKGWPPSEAGPEEDEH
ncbi:TIGR01777 family oxidoreductase [Actinacidiphila acididurans]|uniref:TIGR01777 family oxidoreductase n=1 Tax=Actinacidiphila acididurans TaxID=2784346 RepID=A0ABS2TQR2_9ACTN|nr:TIGR01777 family oxidoreductase [Actinacidiphila acididurans]MBM9505407.1 TIGR01777 family oxidoreductase [Actinacidiphila acididurans]